MTLEDFISRFNSTELQKALNIQHLPNIGTIDDKIIELAATIVTKSEIAYLLEGLECLKTKLKTWMTQACLL